MSSEGSSTEQADVDAVSYDRSGLVDFERALLLAVSDRGRRSSLDVLTKLASGVPSYAPKMSYAAMAALTRPNSVPFPLIDPDGNFGGGSDGPADPEFTKSRPSRIGALAVSAAQNSGPPVPIDLCNGSFHRGGRRPGFEIECIARAVSQLAAHPDLPTSELHSIVGGPAFPGGGHAEGDADALLGGERTDYVLTGVTEVRDGQMFVVGLPPAADITEFIASANGIGRFAFDYGSPDAFAIQVGDLGSESAYSLCDAIRALPAMTSTVAVALGAPLEQILRQWITCHGADAAAAGAALLSDW